jgi:hypothetical protein
MRAASCGGIKGTVGWAFPSISSRPHPPQNCAFGRLTWLQTGQSCCNRAPQESQYRLLFGLFASHRWHSIARQLPIRFFARRKISATTAKSAPHLRNQRDNTLPRSAKLKNLIPLSIKDFFILLTVPVPVVWVILRSSVSMHCPE